MNRQDKRANADPRMKERNNRLKKQAARKAAAPAVEEGERSVVIALGPGICTAVKDEIETHYRCDMVVAPGDEIFVASGKVIGIAPRKTTLSRSDPSNPNREKVIVANIDMVVIVASLTDPPFRTGLIDRYLTATERGGAKPVLCVTKTDLGEDVSCASVYRDLGIPVILSSVESGQGIDELRDLLAGSLSVLVGHSGVGKSSLTNALLDEDRARTGLVNTVNKKGRHTTTASTLYHLENGARIIDTPGIREFGLRPMTAEELAEAFSEFAKFQCRFRDCKHEREPDCGVKQAVEEGKIAAARYGSYLRILTGMQLTPGENPNASSNT